MSARPPVPGTTAGSSGPRPRSAFASSRPPRRYGRKGCLEPQVHRFASMRGVVSGIPSPAVRRAGRRTYSRPEAVRRNARRMTEGDVTSRGSRGAACRAQFMVRQDVPPGQGARRRSERPDHPRRTDRHDVAARRRRLDIGRPEPARLYQRLDAGTRHPCAVPASRNRPETLNPDFLDLLAALVRAEARFLVVGAHAMLHGVPQATGDLDVWVDASAENAALVWRALIAFGAPMRAFGLSQADLTVPGAVFRMGEPPGRIEQARHGARRGSRRHRDPCAAARHRRGFEPAGADGLFGLQTRAATRRAQSSPGARHGDREHLAVSCLVRPKCRFCTNYVLVGGATCAAFRFTWLALAPTGDPGSSARPAAATSATLSSGEAHGDVGPVAYWRSAAMVARYASALAVEDDAGDSLISRGATIAV